MKIKISDATLIQLDWLVAMAQGELDRADWYTDKSVFYLERGEVSVKYSPSSNWLQGGPIIEREYIDIEYFPGDAIWQAQACLQDEYCTQYGLTPLIAAMRCYVASHMGSEVEIPEELA